MKKNNKGFTLVELIVVLVILAILAAILVPALLGYIDRAKQKQYVLNAKSYLTAAQAEMSSLYGENKSAACIVTRSTVVQNTADIATADAVEVGVKGDSGHDAYTIGYVKYEEGDVTLYFDGTTWTEDDPSFGGTTYKVK